MEMRDRCEMCNDDMYHSTTNSQRSEEEPRQWLF